MRYFILCLTLLCCITGSADAREFREKRDIKTPLNAAQFEKKDDGSTAVDTPVKLDMNLVRSAIEGVFSSWGTSDIERYLGGKFPNRSQLLNAFNIHLPHDARLEVKSIRAIRVLSQRSKGGELTSIVAADVETDVYYQDPTLGVQRLNGTGEYVFELVTRES